MLSFSEIPQSSANPLLDFIDQGPEMAEQHRRDMEDWRARQTDTLDRAALDPDAFYADKAIDIPGIDPAHLRRATTVRSYLTLANDGKPVTGDLYPELFRQRIARERFNGRGAESDESFFTEIQNEAQGRKDSAELAAQMTSTAITGTLLQTTDEAGMESMSFDLWRQEAKGKPGYQPGMDFAYREAWNETRQQVKANVEPYLGPLKTVWQGMRAGSADWYAAWEQVPEESRGEFMASLALLARALPAEEQPTFWGNVLKQSSRDLQGQAINVMEGLGDAVNTGSPLNDYGDPFAEQAAATQDRSRKNFIADVERIRDETFDPVKVINPDSTLLRTLERGSYAATGAIATSAVALVPYVGPAATYYHMEESAYRDMRRSLMDGGMTDQAASDLAEALAPAIAVPQAALERIGAGALVGKLPGLEKVLAATANRITSTAGRFAARTGAIAGFETAIENTQDLIPALLQDAASALSQDVPGVTWRNGKDGFFDGYWEKTATTAVAILPLAIIGGAGGISAETRRQAFAAAPDLHLRVLGIPADGVARIREAQAQGTYQAEAQIAQELTGLDPRSEDAKDATQELAEELQSQKDALAAAQRTGAMPTFYRSADGWSVRDGESGAEIGTSTTADGALRLAMAHTSAIEEDNADQIAALATLLEAGDVVASTDQEGVRQTATDLRPGQTVTTSQQSALSEADDLRIRGQIEARERLGGSDGGTARMVLGQSVTETRQKVRNTVNRINAGGSVLTVFHEETHGFFREALATGRLTRDETLAAIRSLETVLAGKVTKDGQQLRFLPDGEVTDLQLDEAVSELMEAEILRTRKTAGRSGTAARSLPPGLVTRNLTAMARLAPGAAAKLRDFIAAVRAFWGLTFQRAAAIKSAIREGTLDEAQLDAFKSKLFGLEDQTDIEQAARDTEARILDGLELPSNPRELDGDPFSIGRTTVTPTADSRLFKGAEGSPTVLGPASFSIRAHHGTPHKVDKFTTGKIGTGEGAQAYGWGLYFAEAQSVAEQYRKTLGLTWDGFTRTDPAGAANFQEEVEEFMLAKPTEAQLLDEMRLTLLGVRDAVYEPDTIENVKSAASSAGNLYTVNLKVEDDQLLDWDKPLSDHPKSLWPSLEKIFGKLESPDGDLDTTSAAEAYSNLAEDSDPESASRAIYAAGIRGIRFLDGNSRGTGEGSYNYVIFDEADIEILEENGQPVAPAFSLGPAALADLLGKDAVSRIKDPVRRAQAMSRIAREMEAARLQFERLELVAGSKRLKKSLSREASIREALRREELENEAWSRHWQILSDDDLVKIKSQPAHALLSDPTNPLRGRIQSRTATIRQNPDLYTFTEPAEYNGSETVSRAVFGGTLTPDQAVEELVSAGLLREGSKPDDLWNLLNAEARSVSNRKRDLEIAKQELREARTQAKDETNVWLREQGVTQETTFGDKQEILRALGVLDGILSSVPAEIRGKIGGYTQLARIASNEAKLSFLKDRLAKVDVELEKYLRDQFDREFLALLDRAKPEKDEAGKKPRGKIGADVHELFAAVRESMTMTGAEVEAEAVALESLVASGDYTAAQESHMTLQANLIRLAGDWGKADAARREAALVEATSIYAAGYMAHKTQTLQKREKRQKIRDILQAATGMAGTREERRGKQRKDETTKAGRALTTLFSLMSFEQVVQRAFGEDTQEARDLVDWERHAAHAKADAVQNKVDQLDDLFTSLAGGKLKGEQLRFAMAQPDAITVDGQTFSELEAITATLMWRQEDGKRHMTGHVDDQGAPAGDWNYTQAFIDQLESKLSTNAKAVRLHLAQQYAAEYDRLNAVFRDLNGVSLPRHKQYSPLTVKPVQSAGGQMLDPVTGMAMSGAGFTPGSLKNRSQSAIAEPDFKDALQVYIGHAKQMEHWIAYAPFTTEAMAILNTRDIGNSVEAAAGKEALGVLRSWLDVFAQGGTRDAAAHLGLNKLLGRITGRAAATALVGRVSVLAIQSTQLGAALAEMPTASYISRLARLFAGRLDWSGALQSDYIQRRRAQMPPIVQQAMEGLTSTKPSRLKYAVRKMGETIAGADALFTAGTFAIVYDYQLQQAQTLGLTGAAAKAYALEAAERSTDRVAQPVRPGTRSLYEVTAVNPLARISWSFASDARQKLALSAYALANKPPAAKARALAVTWIAGGVVATLIRSAMRDIRDDGEDDEIFDDKNWDPTRLALSSLTGPLAGVPALGDAAEAMVFSLFGEYLPEGNLISGFSNAGRSGEKIPDWLTGDREGIDNAIKDTEAILSGFGLLSDSAAAVTSLLHVARDLFGIVQNVAGD
jgi:hypothetical protein